VEKPEDSKHMKDKRGQLWAELGSQSSTAQQSTPPGASGLKTLLTKAEAHPSCWWRMRNCSPAWAALQPSSTRTGSVSWCAALHAQALESVCEAQSTTYGHNTETASNTDHEWKTRCNGRTGCDKA